MVQSISQLFLSDEETVSMVSYALDQAKDEVSKRFSSPMKSNQKVMAEGVSQAHGQLQVSTPDSSVASAWKQAFHQLELGLAKLSNTRQGFQPLRTADSFPSKLPLLSV